MLCLQEMSVALELELELVLTHMMYTMITLNSGSQYVEQSKSIRGNIVLAPGGFDAALFPDCYQK
jgi:hypothetical protein